MMFISRLYLFTFNKVLIKNKLYISQGIILGHVSLQILFLLFLFLRPCNLIWHLNCYGFLIEWILSYPNIMIRKVPNGV